MKGRRGFETGEKERESVLSDLEENFYARNGESL